MQVIIFFKPQCPPHSSENLQFAPFPCHFNLNSHSHNLCSSFSVGYGLVFHPISQIVSAAEDFQQIFCMNFLYPPLFSRVAIYCLPQPVVRNCSALNVAVGRLEFHFHIQEVPARRPATLNDNIRAFPRYLQRNPRIIPYLKPRPLPSTPFIIYYLLILFHAIRS
jgi:hypothetical protein